MLDVTKLRASGLSQAQDPMGCVQAWIHSKAKSSQWGSQTSVSVCLLTVLYSAQWCQTLLLSPSKPLTAIKTLFLEHGRRAARTEGI